MPEYEAPEWPITDRRVHDSPCATLKECGLETRDRLDLVEEDLEKLRNLFGSIDEKMGAIEDIMVTMSEIVEVWREIEGFVNVVLKIGRFLKWLTVFGGSVAAVWYAFTHFGAK